jgi:hypothetical protein
MKSDFNQVIGEKVSCMIKGKVRLMYYYTHKLRKEKEEKRTQTLPVIADRRI